jgi:hypothetical protein
VPQSIFRATVEFHVLCLAALVSADNLHIIIRHSKTIYAHKKPVTKR